MIPILYDVSENEYITNGIGFLSDAISCKVKAVLNSCEYDLTLQYPLSGIHVAQLQRDRQILAKVDPVSAPQPFRISRITRISDDVVTVYAKHKVYDLKGVTVSPFEADGIIQAVSAIKTNSRKDHPFEITTDKGLNTPFSVKVPTSAWSLLGGTKGSLLDVYGGEYEFDRHTVRLLTRRGEDRGVQIRYGKNLTTLEQDENCANVFTAVDPYWQNSAGEVVYLDAPVQIEGVFAHSKIMPLDLSGKFSEKPTKEQLQEAAEAYIVANKVGQPDISLKLEFVALEKTVEYKGKAVLERILLGDTVGVIFEKMNIVTSARAVESLYDSLGECFEYITLGSVKASLATVIASQGKEIAKTPTKSGMRLAIEQLTGSILGARGGSVRLLDENGDGYPDTLYIADNADPSLAVTVWRWNYKGWAASKNGYNGPFEMGATLEGGILAEFIKAGVLQSVDGKIQINLNAGESGPVFNTGISTNGLSVRGDHVGAGEVFSARAIEYTKADNTKARSFAVGFNSTNGADLGGFSETWADATLETPVGINLQMYNQDKAHRVHVIAGNTASIDLYSGGARAGRFVAQNGFSTVNPGKTSLFSGEIAVGGTAEVPGTSMYDLFAIRLGDADNIFQTTVLAYKVNNVIRGVGGWSGTADEYKELFFVSVSIDGETWELIDAKRHSVYAAGGISAGESLSVKKIIGIV